MIVQIALYFWTGPYTLRVTLFLGIIPNSLYLCLFRNAQFQFL